MLRLRFGYLFISLFPVFSLETQKALFLVHNSGSLKFIQYQLEEPFCENTASAC